MGKTEGLSSTIYRYDNKMFRGGDILTDKGAKSLKAMGIQTVFSVTTTDIERMLCKKHNLQLIELPFTKEGLPKQMLKIFLRGARLEKGKCYVHCHSGKNRGGTLMAAYRIHVNKWTFEKAKKEFILLGGKADKFPALINSIK